MSVPPLPRVMVPHPHVRSDAHILSGSPHVVGSRIPVRRLWAWHKGGTAIETLLRRYPKIGASKLLDALSFAYDNQELIEADLGREQLLFEERGGPTKFARPLAQMALPFAAEPAPIAPDEPLLAHRAVDELPAPVKATAAKPTALRRPRKQ